MLSYRHAFHAGNHADILKHSFLSMVLESLKKKDKPYTLIDTHSGAGIYILDDERAVKTGETEAGIIRLLKETGSNQAPEPMKPYLELCRKYASDNRYPGSPELFRNYLRANDRLILIELHNTEIDILRVNMKKSIHDGRLGIHHRDAYTALNALTPPDPRRGLLLMDPSYEVDSDYTNAAESLRDCHRHWPVGVICLWYPLLKHREAETAMLKAALKDSAEGEGNEKQAVSWLCAELLVDSPEREAGLYGSGMFIMNPPWHLDTQLEESLPWLVKALGGHDWSLEKQLR